MTDMDKVDAKGLEAANMSMMAVDICGAWLAAAPTLSPVQGEVEPVAYPRVDGKIAPPVEIGYTNYRGEFAVRCIIPLSFWYGSTDWHPEPQWLVKAYDADKGAERDFAFKDFGPAPRHGSEP